MDGKTANRLKIAIKVAIVVLAYAYAGYRIATAPDIDQLPTYFSEMGLSRSLVLVAILLLMPINWTIETGKWQMLVLRQTAQENLPDAYFSYRRKTEPKYRTSPSSATLHNSAQR